MHLFLIIKNLFQVKKQYYIYRLRICWLKKHNIGLDSTTKIGGGSKLCGSTTGYMSGIGKDCDITNCWIGNYTSIARNVTIGMRNHIHANFCTHDFIYKNHEFQIPPDVFFIDNQYYNVKIGHDVWIGLGAIILKGVEIGNGAIIAAGSVVTKSVPPYAIVGGNPAKFIKWRFSEQVIKQLSEINYYSMDIQQIKEKTDDFQQIVGFHLNEYLKQQRKVKSMLEISRK